jgi:hypothetical protein
MMPSPHFMFCMKAPVVEPVSVVAVVASVVPVPPEPLVELCVPVLVVVLDVEQASTSTSGTAVSRRILEKSSIAPQ